jgi:hypothetical protein
VRESLTPSLIVTLPRNQRHGQQAAAHARLVMLLDTLGITARGCTTSK